MEEGPSKHQRWKPFENDSVKCRCSSDLGLQAFEVHEYLIFAVTSRGRRYSVVEGAALKVPWYPKVCYLIDQLDMLPMCWHLVPCWKSPGSNVHGCCSLACQMGELLIIEEKNYKWHVPLNCPVASAPYCCESCQCNWLMLSLRVVGRVRNGLRDWGFSSAA